MAHDVFISHAQADKTVADMVCATLEQRGIRCWIAPRDILPGSDWGAAIIGAIRASRVMVVVFSGATNTSPHVPREIERAIGHEIPIVPMRVENIEPSGTLEYSLSSVHWLDAISPPVETHIARLAANLRVMLGLPPESPRPVPHEPVPARVTESPPPSEEPPAVEPAPFSPTPELREASGLLSRRALLIAAGLVAVLAITLLISNKDTPPDIAANTIAPGSPLPAFTEVHAAYIVMKIEGKDEAVVRARLQAIAEKARAGEDFAELARRTSDDLYTRGDGGDLGFVKRGAMVREVEDAMFSLEPGRVSDVLKTTYGLIIVKVIARR